MSEISIVDFQRTMMVMAAILIFAIIGAALVYVAFRLFAKQYWRVDLWFRNESPFSCVTSTRRFFKPSSTVNSGFSDASQFWFDSEESARAAEQTLRDRQRLSKGAETGSEVVEGG